jgi:hypothetical protein
MASVRPNTILSGGISPKGCTRELTLPVVMAGSPTLGENLSRASRKPIGPVAGDDVQI